MITKTILGCLLLIVAGLASLEAWEEKPAARVHFQRDIKPILAKNCYSCHGADDKKRSAGLRLDVYEAVVSPRKARPAAIVPGNPGKSLLVERIESLDDAERMPPPETGTHLTPEQISLLKRWISEGAEYEKHWAFVAPQKPVVPRTKDPKWARQTLDHFIQTELEKHGLQPSPEADAYTLLRRVSLDLRGLPPTLAELEAFEQDASSDRYEKMVDQFLADTAYGERWARLWLDLARYADSAGYGSDPLRLNMWRYRDWVIEAFNRNMPYDQFTLEQLAGDLLRNPTLEQRMATAFHRNTMTNTEGGTDREEFRVAAVKDRTNTTFQVWMGLTMGCAQCHSHKYDPISQQEYYQAYAIFNQTADNDLPNEAPTMPAPTAAQIARNQKIDQQIKAIRHFMQIPTPMSLFQQAAWEQQHQAQGSWYTPRPASVRSQAGIPLQWNDEGIIFAEVEPSKRPERDRYTITLPGKALGRNTPVTGLRLETLPAPNSRGAGLADDGNFVLSRVTVYKKPTQAVPPQARFVRVLLPGPQRILSLAEVEVYEGEENLARTGEASQSSEDFRGFAAKAIDGNTEGDFFQGESVTHTRMEENPWWEVKLSREAAIDRIVLWNRTGGVEKRLEGALVQLLDTNHTPIWEQKLTEVPTPRLAIPSVGEYLPLSVAQADHSQNNFSVQNLIRNPQPGQKGWAVAPQFTRPHQAILVLEKPVSLSAEEELVIHLDQHFEQPHYLLGRFRVQLSDDVNLEARSRLPYPVMQALDQPRSQRSPEQAALLSRHFREVTPSYRAERETIQLLEKSRPTISQLPVMVELPADKRRTTRVMVKGNFLDQAQEVQPGLPRLFPAAEPSNPNRYDLARWLVDPQNPLTARVAVNRLWSQLFGVGLVESEEDFGNQGELPSHPELLDYLAWRYQHELQWNTKAILRELVTSATYRQSSKVTADRLEKDPQNRLLSRGPRFRLEAEMIRDQALALSGLLSRKVGGPSVFPRQPDGLWQAAFNGERTWMTSRREDRYRRGLYTFWRRTIPYPSMAAFDAPSRELCQVRRTRSNTPVQAFVTLNDPVYVEAAQALARLIVREGGTTLQERIHYGLKRVLCRPPTVQEMDVLKALHQDEYKRQQAANPDEVKKLASEPLGAIPEGMDPVDLATWTVLANVLLNLDAVLNK